MDAVQTPIQAIRSAFEMFVFFCFVNDAIGTNRINLKNFNQQTKLEDNRKGLVIKHGFTDEQLKADGRNLVLMAFGTTAIATSKAMEAVFGKPNPAHTGKFESARVILYQIRCAFAHDPLIPVWTPNVKSYNRIYQVTVQVARASGKTGTRTIKLHPPTLKGLEPSTDDLGGLAGYIGLLQYCFVKVQTHPNGNKPYTSSVKP